jgi:hypothetical protein
MRTTKEQIFEYHYENTDELGMGADACDWRERCWRCGYVSDLERCHIIPKSLGGQDSPENYILLCNKCHQEAPNVKDNKQIMKWIKETNVGAYDIFWELRDIFIGVQNEISVHFGQGGNLNQSTNEWALIEFKKRLKPETWFYISHNKEAFDGFRNSLKYAINFT